MSVIKFYLRYDHFLLYELEAAGGFSPFLQQLADAARPLLPAPLWEYSSEAKNNYYTKQHIVITSNVVILVFTTAGSCSCIILATFKAGS